MPAKPLKRRPRTVRCHGCRNPIKVKIKGRIPTYCSQTCKQQAYLKRRYRWTDGTARAGHCDRSGQRRHPAGGDALSRFVGPCVARDTSAVQAESQDDCIANCRRRRSNRADSPIAARLTVTEQGKKE